MKSRRDHVLPLPTQAIEILRELEGHTFRHPDSFIFASTRSKTGFMAENTLRMAPHLIGVSAGSFTGSCSFRNLGVCGRGLGRFYYWMSKVMRVFTPGTSTGFPSTILGKYLYFLAAFTAALSKIFRGSESSTDMSLAEPIFVTVYSRIT